MHRLPAVCLVVFAALPLFATESNPSREQRASIEKLLELMDVDRSGAATIDALFGQIQKQMQEMAEAEGESDSLVEANELFDEFRARAAKIDFHGLLHEEYVRMYGRYFTEKELDDLIAFYSTPTGRKTIEVLPRLMSDAVQAGGQILGPKIEQAMTEAAEAVEKKRPWRKTMADIRSIAVSVEAYAVDNERYPAGDLEAIAAVVEPTYIRVLPRKDMWGHSYAYVVSPDGQRYRVVSAGADGIFEWDSRRIAEASKGEEAQTRYRERLEDDIIFEDGMFLQAPRQAEPKEDEQ
jgi:hypothetical protein